MFLVSQVVVGSDLLARPRGRPASSATVTDIAALVLKRAGMSGGGGVRVGFLVVKRES